MANLQGSWSEDDERGPTDQDRELYERAHNAANEAVREGDAQLKAAMAAAGASRQCIEGASTRMERWSLNFNSHRLEAAYRRKSTTNSDNYDYIPVMFKIATSVPHFGLTFGLLGGPTSMSSLEKNVVHAASSSQNEPFFAELWATWAAIFCLAVLAVQLTFPQWLYELKKYLNELQERDYLSSQGNRGATLKYLVMLLWAWESVQLYLNTNDMKYILMEVAFVNLFMSFLHRVPYISHVQVRGIGFGEQLLAVLSKGLDFKRTRTVILFSLLSHSIGLGIAYCLDRAARMWSIFYPELLDSPQPTTSPKAAVTYEQIMAPRRALGGFAGGFGGVSSLKCNGPVSTSLSPISSSSSLSERTSDSSSGYWAGVGLPESGVSCGEVVSNAHESSGYQHREFAPYAATSACSQVGMENSEPQQYTRRRGLKEVADNEYL